MQRCKERSRPKCDQLQTLSKREIFLKLKILINKFPSINLVHRGYETN